ncbi:Uncharacterized protein Adt_18396 [Abeliophyllum distichum]|uniref:Uncharacterized protein n=1 Tax=Abeliophyllum distichum TaxID=126358 RepID=A0ABD1TJA3_9LAMI
MEDVAQFIYDKDDAWPHSTRDFEHSKLIDSLLILNLYVSYNIDPNRHHTIDPSRHHTTFNDAKAWFLIHLAHERKFYLGSHIYTLIRNLGCMANKRHTAIFLGLIAGICAAAGVHIAFDEVYVKPKAPINQNALTNARRHIVRPRGPALAMGDQHVEGQLPYHPHHSQLGHLEIFLPFASCGQDRQSRQDSFSQLELR